MSNKVDLASFDDDFNNTSKEHKPEDSPYNNTPIPDGPYQAKVESAEVMYSKSGRPMLRWTFSLLHEDFKGRKVWRHNLLDNEQGHKILISDLYICGITLGTLSELHTRLHELLDLKLELEIRDNGETDSGKKLYNVYINKLIGKCDPSEGVDEQLVPF